MKREKTKADEFIKKYEFLNEQRGTAALLVEDINKKLRRVKPESFSDKEVTIRNKR